MASKAAQESPHFENGLISVLFGPHVERMGSPKAPHLSWSDLTLDDCETLTRTSGLVIRDSPHQNANLQLHFGPRKNEGMAEDPDPSGSRRSRFASATERSNRMRTSARAALINSSGDPSWTKPQCGFASGRKFGISVGRKFHDPAFAPGMSGSNRPSTRMNGIQHGLPERLAQAWLVPRWMTTSPALSSVSPLSRTSVISPEM